MELEIRVSLAVDDCRAERLPPFLQKQESEIGRMVTRTVMTQLQPSVDLFGTPLGRAQPPLCGDRPDPQAPPKYVSNLTGLAPHLKTGTGIPDGNGEDVPRVSYLLPVPFRLGPNGDPHDSSSGDGSPDRSRSGRQGRSSDSSHKTRGMKRKTSRRGKRREHSDSDTKRSDFTNSVEDSNHSDSDESYDSQGL